MLALDPDAEPEGDEDRNAGTAAIQTIRRHHERHSYQDGGRPLPPYPRATRADRVASAVRARGRPLPLMRDWAEADERHYIGIEPATEKARQIMSELKQLSAHRAAIEKSVEKLSARRDVLRAELTEVESELKLLLSMLRVGAPPGSEPTPAEGDAEPGKGKRKKKWDGVMKQPKSKAKLKNGHAKSGDDPQVIALRLLADAPREGISRDDVAAQTGQSPVNAGQMLQRMVKNELASKVSRGRFGHA